MSLIKSMFSKSKVQSNLKLAKQYALDCEYRKALEAYCAESLFGKPLLEMDAEDAEHFMLCGHAFQQFYYEYKENLDAYTRQLEKYQELKGKGAQEKLTEPREYLQKAATCYENVVKILCGFDFDSFEATKMVALAFHRLFETKAELEQSYAPEALEFVNWVALHEVKVKKFEFLEDMKQLIAKQLGQLEGQQETLEKVQKW